METKRWIPLLISLSVLLPAVSANSIKPLEPLAGTVGSEVNITCDATITGQEGIKLKKLNTAGEDPTIVQLMPPDFVNEPKDTTKYQLTKTSLHGFYLTIKDVVFEDAARYRCSMVVDDSIYELTTLVLVRAPSINMMENIEAGQTTQITCDAEYQVPSGLDKVTEEAKFPKLAAHVGEVALTGGVEVKTDTNIKMTWNTTLGTADDQKSLVCKVYTNQPVYEQTSSKKLNIIFDVQNIALSPEKETYTKDEMINCTAEGNPAPDVKWTANSTNTMGNNAGPNLLIVESMIGPKQEIWKCTATSSKTGTVIHKYITFTVGRTTVAPPGPAQSSPTAAIAAGVTVPLVIIIAVVVVVVVVMMRKKKKTEKPPPGEEEGTVSSGPFTNPLPPHDDQHNKPNNPTAYQSEKPSVPPHQQEPYPNEGYNNGYQPSKYDEDLNMDMSAEMARRALTPLPVDGPDYDIPYNDGRGQPRLADVAAHVAPPGGLPPDQQYSVVNRGLPTPTDAPDIAAAHPGLQQVYNMPKPRLAPRQPADTTV